MQSARAGTGEAPTARYKKCHINFISVFAVMQLSIWLHSLLQSLHAMFQPPQTSDARAAHVQTPKRGVSGSSDLAAFFSFTASRCDISFNCSLDIPSTFAKCCEKMVNIGGPVCAICCNVYLAPHLRFSDTCGIYDVIIHFMACRFAPSGPTTAKICMQLDITCVQHSCPTLYGQVYHARGARARVTLLLDRKSVISCPVVFHVCAPALSDILTGA